MKRMQAIFAAALITTIIALGIVGVGVNAAINPNSVPPSNSPNAAVAVATTADPNLASAVQTAQTQIDQLKSLITQYQAREQQYQSQQQQYQQQISAANAQLQQLQAILTQLQQAGVIRIAADGTITVGSSLTRGFGDDGPRGNSTSGGTTTNGNTTNGGATFR